jgi:DNA polymerase-3 subunit delta
MAIQRSQELRREIAAVRKGTVRPLYLLFGTEAYLVRTGAEGLVRAIAASTNAEIIHVDATGKPPAAVLQPIASLSLFSASQVVVVRGFTHLLTGDDADRLLAGLDSCLGEGSSLVLVAPGDSGDKVDKRVKGYKGIAKRGLVLELNQQSDKDLADWLVEQAAAEGKRLAPAAVALLLDRVGTDMQTLRNELDKAVLYCLDRDRIEAADLEQLVGKSREDAVWSVAEAAANRNPVRAMELLHDLFAAGQYPLVVLTLMVRQFRHLLQARLLWEEAGQPAFRDPNSFRTRVAGTYEAGLFGGGPDDVTTQHPYAVFKKFELARRHDADDLAAFLGRLRRADRDAKSGMSAGMKETMEELILDLCVAAHGRAA